MAYCVNIEGIVLELDINNPPEQEERIKQYMITAVRKITGMNRKDFAEWLCIPYRTLSDWEYGNREMPTYVLNLIAYKVRREMLDTK